MDLTDFNIGIEDVGMAVSQELWNKVALMAADLATETKDMVIEKDSFREFSRAIFDLSTLLKALNAKKIEAAKGNEFTKAALQTLDGQLMKTHEIIRRYKYGSRLHLLLHARSILSQMQELAKEIATTISLFQLANLEMTLNLKTMTDQVINNLTSMELRSAVVTEIIASEMETLMCQDNRNRENAVKLLGRITEAIGASSNVSLVQNELALLKQEKEEMEDQKKQAEALQLSQLIQLLYSTEIVTRLQNEDISTHQVQHPISSFTCPLCKEIMADPVTIFCGHSFERKAIQNHFNRGEKTCPTCGEELPSLALTPNVNLRSSIEEWKQRDMDLIFRAAIYAINSEDHSRQTKGLEDLQVLMRMPQYANKVAAGEGFIPKLVGFLKDARLNTTTTLKCIYILAKHCHNHKEAIVQAGVVRRIMKQICRGETVPEAIAVLLELSNNEAIGDKIGSTRGCIPLLVSLLDNKNPEISEKAKNVLDNLSSNTSFAVKMAEAGYFQPFISRFNQGSHESRAWMADDLLKMPLKEQMMKDLKDKQFIGSLIHMLSSNSPSYKFVCLKCIKKLIAYPKMAERVLSDSTTIPTLLGLISIGNPDPHLKQEIGEILALLVAASRHPQLEMHQGLRELQSNHNINLFLHLVATSNPQIKIQFLHLLVEVSNKSDIAKHRIRCNSDVIACLFSSLFGDQPPVKRWVLKLIHSISEGHSDGVPLPPSPGKETAINNLVVILTHSLDTEERSLAAGIISQLPKDDTIIDEILRKSEALKSISEVICSAEEENNAAKIAAYADTSLLENALAALLWFTEPTKPELQRELGKLELYPPLVRILSRGTTLAKKRTAIALAQLSRSTSLSVSEAKLIEQRAKNYMPQLHVMKLFPNTFWCFSNSSVNKDLCSVHGAACSPRHSFCLIKADAVKPLVRTLSEIESGVAEAALTALETLLTDHSSLSNATAAIVDSQGVAAILQVLEKGSFSAKTKGLNLFHEIVKHTEISDSLFERSERILIQLLQEDALKKKVALVLRQMNIIPDQSSYF